MLQCAAAGGSDETDGQRRTVTMHAAMRRDGSAGDRQNVMI